MDTRSLTHLVKKELEIVQRELESGESDLVMTPIDGNMTKLSIEFNGPVDSPYEGGRFRAKMTLMPYFPVTPPLVSFVQHVWHPNVSYTSGYTCMDVMNSAWNPNMSLRALVLALQTLLKFPGTESPVNALPAKQILQNPDIYKEVAAYWAHIFSGSPRAFPVFDQRMRDVMDRGYNYRQALFALSSQNFDVDQAVQWLKDTPDYMGF